MEGSKDVRFFLGSNTKRGFVPLFDRLKDPLNGHRFYILKGGPGSGKSTLMKRIAKTLEEHKHYIEYMPCASDPDSLDAIYDHDAQIVIVDGTAPHTLDPDNPGAYDMIINLGDAWMGEKIKPYKREIISLNHEISKCHKMATACIKSAAALLDHNRMIAGEYLNYVAIGKLVQTITGKLADSLPEGMYKTDNMISDEKSLQHNNTVLSSGEANQVNESIQSGEISQSDTTPLQEKKSYKLDSVITGEESFRLLSAVSVGRTHFFADTLKTLCPQLYIIDDEWGCASHTVLSEIQNYAGKMKLDFITCYCSISTPDKIDHILFPSIGFGITTSNSYHHTSGEAISAANLLMKPVGNYDLESMTTHSAMARDLISTAAGHVAQAKALHDRLEKFYINAMDFTLVEQVYHTLIDDIL